jgi:hypothetical protein
VRGQEPGKGGVAVEGADVQLFGESSDAEVVGASAALVLVEMRWRVC